MSLPTRTDSPSNSAPRFNPPQVTDETFRLLVESVKDYAIIMLDPEGRVISWNKGAERIKGYATHEILGKHLSTFYTPEAIADHKPEIELKVAREAGRFEDLGWRVRKDGSLFWANVVITAVRDQLGTLTGFTKVTRDITDRKKAEDELRESEERFRLMVDSVRDYAIYTLDADGTVTSWNSGAERIKGYKPEEIIGQNYARFYTEADLAAGKPQREIAVAKAEGRFEEEGWRVRKDGTRFWANVILTVQRDPNGKIRGFTKVTRDMTDRKRAEDEMRALNHRLTVSNRELEQFASVASHDLQEPLRKVQAFSDQLKAECGDRLSEDGKFYIDRMCAAAQRMRNLIDDLLTFSRVSNKEQSLQEVSLTDVVSAVLNDLDQRIDELGATVEVGRLPKLQADPLQMRQLFQNLVSNGLKFHRQGVVPVLKLDTERQDDDCFTLVVEDNGIGFEQKYAQRIFTLFQRLHARDQYEGTGLGLSICRRIAERHGGTIAAESTPGRGSRFVITLPLRQSRPCRVREDIGV